MARAIVSAAISFGLVAIPIKVYKATDSDKVSFKQLTPAGNPVEQKLFDKVTGDEVERSDLLKGYEVAKDTFVQFSKEEITSLESPKTAAFSIKEFVPISTIDLCQIENTYYLSPDKGGDGAYALFSQAMQEEKKVAVGIWSNRGKDNLVLIRPHGDGLILHVLFYANEVRDFNDVNKCAKLDLAKEELDMAKQLIKQLSSKKMADTYADGYRTRVKEAVEAKKAGKAITITAEAPKANVMNLMAQLKASLTKKSA